MILETSPQKIQADTHRLAKDRSGVRPVQFLDLPRELRDIIYRYTVRPADGLAIYHTAKYWSHPASRHLSGISKDCACKQWICTRRGCASRQPAITAVSRQLRHESLAMFYAVNEFVFKIEVVWEHRVWVDDLQHLRVWLEAIGVENVSHIRKLVVYLDHACDYIDSHVAPADRVADYFCRYSVPVPLKFTRMIESSWNR